MNPLPAVDREQFIRQLGRAVVDARENQLHLGLLLVDLANLAQINYLHGYEAGDRALLTAYSQLLSLSKLPDSVFRVGSHRFSFILSNLGNPAFIALALNRVQRTLGSDMPGEAGLPGADIRIGLAINRCGDREAMTMLAQAEGSLTQAKLGGVQRIEELLAEDSGEPERMRLRQQLSEALQGNEFELYFQPKIELATGKLRSAEALLRWRSPEGENISPQVIVDWAESTGRSYDLTKWVVHRALRQMRHWQGNLDIGVAVNIPANLAGEPDLPALLHDAIAIWGVAPGMVTLELTERAIIEDKQSGYDNLLKLKAMGINISIDDFGTGYSSLSYFKHIPAAELKIDRSFVESMLVNPQDLELVKIIIHIAHRFGLAVVAEGVEDRGSLDKLRELGCDLVQGFFLSRPLSAEEFEGWAGSWRGLSR